RAELLPRGADVALVFRCAAAEREAGRARDAARRMARAAQRQIGLGTTHERADAVGVASAAFDIQTIADRRTARVARARIAHGGGLAIAGAAARRENDRGEPGKFRDAWGTF